MSDSKSNPDGWSSCQSGEIGRMVGHIKAERRSRAVRQVVVPALVMLVVTVVAGYYVAALPGPPGGIECTDVAGHLVDYRDGKIRGSLAEQLDTHLRECPGCRKRYEEMGGQVRAGADVRVALVSIVPSDN